MGFNSVIAVLGGMVLMFFLTELIEPPTVSLLAPQRPATMDAYMAARNEPTAIPGRAAVYAFVGLLAGFMVARLAGEHHLAHAAAAVALQAMMMLRSFAADPAPNPLPLWGRGVLIAAAGAGMLAGAAIRARAARLNPRTEAGQ